MFTCCFPHSPPKGTPTSFQLLQLNLTIWTKILTFTKLVTDFVGKLRKQTLCSVLAFQPHGPQHRHSPSNDFSNCTRTGQACPQHRGSQPPRGTAGTLGVHPQLRARAGSCWDEAPQRPLTMSLTDQSRSTVAFTVISLPTAASKCQPRCWLPCHMGKRRLNCRLWVRGEHQQTLGHFPYFTSTAVFEPLQILL